VKGVGTERQRGIGRLHPYGFSLNATKKIVPTPSKDSRLLSLAEPKAKTQVGGKGTCSRGQGNVLAVHDDQINGCSQLAQPTQLAHQQERDLLGSLVLGWASVVSDVETHGKNVWTSVAQLLPTPAHGQSTLQVQALQYSRPVNSSNSSSIPLTSRSRHLQPPTPLIEQSTGLLGSRPLYASKSDEPDLPLSRSSLAVRKGVREHNRRHKNNEQTKDEYDTVYTATLSKIDRWTLSPHQQSSSGLSLPVADADTLSKIDRWMSSTEQSLHRHSSLPVVKNDLQTEPTFAEHKKTSTPSGFRTLRHVPHNAITTSPCVYRMH